MAYLDAPHSSYSVIQENDDGQVDSLARALLNSNLPTRELSSVQAVMTDYEELQPNLQTLAHNDSLLERIDNHSRADCETVINSVDSLRSVGRIYRSLTNENLSQEATEVINVEGGRLVNNLLNIYSRTTAELQQNTRVLRQAVIDNTRTRDDPTTNTLLEQQLQITENISNDPRTAYQQVSEASTISSQLLVHIEDLEPNENAAVRIAARGNAQYLKYAVGIFFIGAAAVAMCAGVTYLAPVVSGALASLTTTFGGEPIAMIPVVMAFDNFIDRFYLHILPKIRDTIEGFDLESSSMKHILRAAHYPNLYTLDLYNIDEKLVRSLFTGKKVAIELFLF
ncbi:unnamed protein product [Rotaria sp. Silwood1]|nr:unnamed protein product [Rotaria sp. Silwood1]